MTETLPLTNAQVNKPRILPQYDNALVELNREMERKFLAGEIPFSAFDWHLRSICGV